VWTIACATIVGSGAEPLGAPLEGAYAVELTGLRVSLRGDPDAHAAMNSTKTTSRSHETCGRSVHRAARRRNLFAPG
jgi:hypothetical protein